jgi:hypothetical protein
MTDPRELIRAAILLEQAAQILRKQSQPTPEGTHDSSRLDAFIRAARITKNPSRSAKFYEFYALYEDWCSQQGIRPSSKQRVGTELQIMGFAKGRRSWGTQILGLGLPCVGPCPHLTCQ